MDFDTMTMRDVVRKLKPTADKKAYLDVLRSILVDGDEDGHVRFTTTTIDVTSTVVLPREGPATPFTVNVGTLEKMAAQAPKDGTVSLSVNDDNRTVVDIGGVESASTASPASEFPKLPNPSTTIDNFPVDRFAETVPFTATDATRPILTGVHVAPDGVVAATDSYRLVVVETGISLALDSAVLIPRQAAMLAVKHGGDADVETTFDGQDIRFTFTLPSMTYAVTARVIEGEFPNYGQLIPAESETPLSLKLGADAVKNLTTLKKLDSDKAPVRLTVNDVGQIVGVGRCDGNDLTANLDGHSEGECDGEVVAFNINYLLDFVAVSDSLTLHGVDHLKPWVFRDSDTIRLLMPVRTH